MRPPPGSERLEKATPPHSTVETAAASGFGEAVTASLGFRPRGSTDGWPWRVLRASPGQLCCGLWGADPGSLARMWVSVPDRDAGRYSMFS